MSEGELVKETLLVLDSDGFFEAVSAPLEDPLEDIDVDALTERLCELDGVKEGLRLTVLVKDEDPLAVMLGELDGDAARETLAHCVTVPQDDSDGVALTDALFELDSVTDAVTLRVLVTDTVPLLVTLRELDSDAVREALAHCVAVPQDDSDSVALTDALFELDSVTDAVTLRVLVTDTVPLLVTLRELDGDAVREALAHSVAELDGDNEDEELKKRLCELTTVSDITALLLIEETRLEDDNILGEEIGDPLVVGAASVCDARPVTTVAVTVNVGGSDGSLVT